MRAAWANTALFVGSGGRYIPVMAIRKIARMGHPVLLGKAEPVTDTSTPDVQRLIDDMIETLADAGGVGLAGPQVYARQRIILVFDVADRDEPRDEVPRVLINPEIEPVGDAMDVGFEGCLSIPGLCGAVPRFRQVTYRALDRQGHRIEGETEGYAARILQHEVDHLDGILYTMRMDDLRLLSFDSEYARLAAALDNEAGEESEE